MSSERVSLRLHYQLAHALRQAGFGAAVIEEPKAMLAVQRRLYVSIDKDTRAFLDVCYDARGELAFGCDEVIQMARQERLGPEPPMNFCDECKHHFDDLTSGTNRPRCRKSIKRRGFVVSQLTAPDFERCEDRRGTDTPICMDFEKDEFAIARPRGFFSRALDWLLFTRRNGKQKSKI